MLIILFTYQQVLLSQNTKIMVKLIKNVNFILTSPDGEYFMIVIM